MRERKEEAYRIYVTDALRIIGQNTAKYAGGSYQQQRFADIIRPHKDDGRIGEEIAADVIKRAGLKVVSSNKSV